MTTQTANSQPFLTDIQELRRRARQSIEKGALTSSYGLPVAQTVEILQSAVATELVCILRYKMHAVAAQGIEFSEARAEFEQHATDELAHLDLLADRINQLGGIPNMNPEGLLSRSHTEYGDAKKLIDMIKENLIAERIAIDSYTEMIRFFGDKDISTRTMLEGILKTEEDHANDMHDLLTVFEGRTAAK